MANTGIYDEDFEDIDSVFEAESDTDSNFADSPADGYFSDRAHPTDVFVENSSISAEAEAKAREAAEQRASSSRQAPPSHTSPAGPSPQPRAWSAAETTTLDTEAPPPDYEAATQASSSRYASPTSPQHFDYGSLSGAFTHLGRTDHGSSHYNNVVESRHEQVMSHTTLPSTAYGQPQSMSDPTQQQQRPDEETGLLDYQPGSKRGRWCGLRSLRRSSSWCNWILVVAVVVLIVVVTGGSSQTSREDQSGEDDSAPEFPVHDPSKGTPTTPTQPAKPSTPVWPSNPAIPSEAPVSSECPYEYYSETASFEFNGIQNFSFAEFIERGDHLSGGLGGQVTIHPAEDGQDSDIKLYLTYATTRPWKVVQSKYEKTENSFILRSPTAQNDYASYDGRPCMYVFVAIYLRPDVILEGWETTTSNLNIEVLEGVFDRKGSDRRRARVRPTITGLSTFNAVRGNVKAGFWSSRETVIEVIAGSIKGTFALYDLLSCKSQAGSIDVDVEPKAADKEHPHPAESTFSSVAGSITARYPRRGYIPERDYKTRVEGVSSGVYGSWILGSLTSFHTQAGRIEADLLPFFDRDSPTKLYTDTRSGQSKLYVLSPYDHPGKPWAKSYFAHKTTSTSGAIDISYPAEWEGGISVHSTSGGVKVGGQGVRVITDHKLGPMHTVTAIKGTGSNSLDAQSVSGSVKIEVRDP